MSSGSEQFKGLLLEQGRRRGCAGGATPVELADRLGLDRAAAAEVLAEFVRLGWFEAGDDLWDGQLSAAAPARVPRFGSFAADGAWSEDRWGHRIFHPRTPRPDDGGGDPEADDSSPGKSDP